MRSRPPGQRARRDPAATYHAYAYVVLRGGDAWSCSTSPSRPPGPTPTTQTSSMGRVRVEVRRRCRTTSGLHLYLLRAPPPGQRATPGHPGPDLLPRDHDRGAGRTGTVVLLPALDVSASALMRKAPATAIHLLYYQPGHRLPAGPACSSGGHQPHHHPTRAVWASRVSGTGITLLRRATVTIAPPRSRSRRACGQGTVVQVAPAEDRRLVAAGVINWTSRLRLRMRPHGYCNAALLPGLQQSHQARVTALDRLGSPNSPGGTFR